MAFCVKCGDYIQGEFVEGANDTCIHCSPTIVMPSVATVISRRENKKTESPIKRKRNPFEFALKFVALLIILGIFGILLLFSAGAFIAYLDRASRVDSSKNTATPQYEQKTQQPQPTHQAKIENPKMDLPVNRPANYFVPRETPELVPQRQVLIDESFTLAATEGKSRIFELTTKSKILGSFSAVGGGRNDAQCLIMNDYELENFKNGNQYRRYYDSGSVTNGKLEVNGQDIILPPGKYALVFKNPAWFDSKAVKAKIWIEKIY